MQHSFLVVSLAVSSSGMDGAPWPANSPETEAMTPANLKPGTALVDREPSPALDYLETSADDSTIARSRPVLS